MELMTPPHRILMCTSYEQHTVYCAEKMKAVYNSGSPSDAGTCGLQREHEAHDAGSHDGHGRGRGEGHVRDSTWGREQRHINRVMGEGTTTKGRGRLRDPSGIVRRVPRATMAA